MQQAVITSKRRLSAKSCGLSPLLFSISAVFHLIIHAIEILLLLFSTARSTCCQGLQRSIAYIGGAPFAQQNYEWHASCNYSESYGSEQLHLNLMATDNCFASMSAENAAVGKICVRGSHSRWAFSPVLSTIVRPGVRKIKFLNASCFLYHTSNASRLLYSASATSSNWHTRS